MRLTLRTLLAYLDDVLDPATLKEIGTRISESAPAAATVARIKEVVRRRRIAAPELTGSGSAPDPNLVGEYLDNTLAADAVPALEKLCLDSDMHLAEVASSHQILSAVLGEPVEVPVSTRERMYALVIHTPHIEVRPSAEGHTTGANGVIPKAETPAFPVRPPMTPPDYLRPSMGRNLLLGLLVSALGLGWLGWVLKDQGLLSGFGGQSVTEAEPLAGSDGVTPADSGKPAQPAAVGPTHSTHVNNALASATNAANPAEMRPEPQPPTPEPTVPSVATAVVVGLAPQPEPVVVPVVPVKSFPAMLYVNAEGILIARDPQSGQWNVMPRRALVHAGDEIATPDPFQSEFTINGHTLEVTLYGGARVRLEPGLGEGLLMMTIDRGRVAFRRPLAGENQEPVSISLNLRGQLAELTLHEPGTQCAVEVSPRAPQGRRPDPLLPLPEGGVHVVAGTVALAWNGAPAVAIGSDIGYAAWPVTPNPLSVGPQRAIPNWLAPEGIPLTSADKTRHRMFEKEFAVDQPVSMSIPALVSDRREAISSLATYTLGLVDDVPMLVKALQSEHEETRLAAIWCLRGWLPTDPNNTALLTMEVERFFPDDDVADVVDLLWGYSLEDARDKTISGQLVAWMDHKQIAIRELAFSHVSRLTGRNSAHGYRPNLADSPRNAALMGWRNHLEKNGGQLVK
jgi:hypothetical protein